VRPGGRRKVDTRVMVNLVNARVPKYIATNLFLRVIAYTLRQNRIGQFGGQRHTRTYLITMKKSEEVKRNTTRIEDARNSAMHLGRESVSAHNSSSMRTTVRSLTRSVNQSGQKKNKVKTVRCGAGAHSFGQTSEVLGVIIPRIFQNRNAVRTTRFYRSHR